MVAATYNENLTVNVISGESYFVTFDFERGIYFNMLSVKMCVKRALTWLLLPHAHKLCNLTHDFSPIWPQKPRFGKYEITTKQQYLKIIFFYYYAGRWMSYTMVYVVSLLLVTQRHNGSNNGKNICDFLPCFFYFLMLREIIIGDP